VTVCFGFVQTPHAHRGHVQNDDAAMRSIFFFMIGGNFEVPFKAVANIELKVRPWS